MIFNFLILISAYAVYLAIKKVLQQRKCLEEEVFELYKKNRLDSSERRRVTRHLGVCKKCQRRMIEDESDLEHLIS